MKADISRETFQAVRDIRRVVAQQGRPWIDADWNEQVAVLLHRLETLAADLFGDYAGIDSGFSVEPYEDKNNNPVPRTFASLPGRYYLHGLMCENHEGWKSQRPEDFEAGQTYLVYLHAWEEYESALQNPALAEPALRGVESSGRTRVRWEIGSEKVKDKTKAWQEFKQQHDLAAARLKIQVRPGATGQDPCRVHGRALYRGVRNTVYRVEAWEAKPGSVQLKWARDNAATLVPVSKEGTGLRCLRAADLNDSFDQHGWVELYRLPNPERSGTGRLYRIESLDRDSGVIQLATEPEAGDRLFARPWSGVLDLKAGWVALDQGLELSLDTTRKGELRPGQYWLIPVRTEGGGQVYWPTDSRGGVSGWIPLDEELKLRPGARPQEPDLSAHETLEKADGVYRRNHYYGPLAYITFDGKGILAKTGIEDLRHPYNHP